MENPTGSASSVFFSHGESAGAAGLIGIAGIFNYLHIILAIVAIFLGKGKLAPERATRTLS